MFNPLLLNENLILNDSNFLLYAARNYSNPCCDMKEFTDDLKRFKYIKRLFNRYKSVGDLKERLLLNHIIILYNVFGESATMMLFYKLQNYYSYLKPFLLLLNFLPEALWLNGAIIDTNIIYMDKGIVERLRGIANA